MEWAGAKERVGCGHESLRNEHHDSQYSVRCTGVRVRPGAQCVDTVHCIRCASGPKAGDRSTYIVHCSRDQGRVYGILMQQQRKLKPASQRAIAAAGLGRALQTTTLVRVRSVASVLLGASVCSKHIARTHSSLLAHFRHHRHGVLHHVMTSA